MRTVWVQYKLYGEMPVQVPDNLAQEELQGHVRYLIDDGTITDSMLIDGLEKTDAYGIDGDAIEIIEIER